jgi:hypothetical protein
VTESQTPSVLDDLTALERDVVNAARCGVPTRPGTAVDVTELEVTDDPDLRVRAVVIRELLMGRRGELDPRGLRVTGIRVVGQLDLDHVTAVTGLSLTECALPDGITCSFACLRATNLSGSLLPGLAAEGMRADENLLLRNITVRAADPNGAVRLAGARIGGRLDLDGSEITNDAGPALQADRLHTGENLSLRKVVVHAADQHGAVRLAGADIGAQLNLDDSEITNDIGPALTADSLRTGAALFLRNVAARGAGGLGAVRLLGAHIHGQLYLDGSEVTNDTGPALYADHLHADTTLFLRNVTMRAAGEAGAVRLVAAHIGARLYLDGSEITNDTGAALIADSLRIDQNLFLENATVRGSGGLGAVRLVGAHIGGQARFSGTQLGNDSGPLLELAEVQVGAALFLPASTVCPAAGNETTRRGCVDHQRWMSVEGLVFPSLSDVSWRQWLHLLVHHTRGYSPQPYRQLATVERAAGHDNNARHVLILQQEDLRRRAPETLGGWVGQTRHRLWGWLGRYGYRAHRLVISLALVLALAAALGYIAGHIPTRPDHHAAERVPRPTATALTPGTACSTAELIGVGIDRGLPLGATGIRARCDLDTSTRWGQAFTYAIWALQALVWALATLAIAAYTGLVRKPT